jgi:hypothetical protein
MSSGAGGTLLLLAMSSGAGGTLLLLAISSGAGGTLLLLAKTFSYLFMGIAIKFIGFAMLLFSRVLFTNVEVEINAAALRHTVSAFMIFPYGVRVRKFPHKEYVHFLA